MLVSSYFLSAPLSKPFSFSNTYRKIPIIRPGLIFVQKAFLVGLISGELIIGGNFEFQSGLDVTIKTA